MIVKRITDAFYKSGLVDEFFETLINDTSIPVKLRRQIWALVSIDWQGNDTIVEEIAIAFNESTDASNLIELWSNLVLVYWPMVRACPLRSEIDAL